jgi:hypothetical protein
MFMCLALDLTQERIVFQRAAIPMAMFDAVSSPFFHPGKIFCRLAVRRPGRDAHAERGRMKLCVNRG